MSKEERKEQIENIAEQFVVMDEASKGFITGYMTGVQEERAKWLRKENNGAAVVTV